VFRPTCDSDGLPHQQPGLPGRRLSDALARDASAAASVVLPCLARTVQFVAAAA
jgi:hypothetical protein